MNRSKQFIPLFLSCTVFSGCANMTTGQQVGTAAAGCGAIGLIVGLATGDAGIGAAAGGGCLVVGVAAIAVNHYQSKQTHSVNEDRQMYGYSLTDISKPMVQIRNGSSSPSQLKAGDTLTVVTDYSVITPQNQAESPVSIEETLVLMQDGKELKTLDPRTEQRTAGGWNSSSEITIPDKMPAGTYVIEHRVKVGDSYDVDKSVFVVTEA